ncbi:porin family protein [Thiohalobacter sp.]|uniref:porin family protein n=1 Tax=Thiohalobacter sp. TaxID=2025948 RepID=UPI0026292300|nr:porin family protein [Thiohalobacter sp.]
MPSLRCFLLGLLLVTGAAMVSAASSPGDWAAWERRSLEEAGDPEFDLAFAVVAIETGHPNRAVFALERVLLLEPWNHRARLELGRAFHVLGEHARARAAFEAVLEASPPPAVADKARAWIAAIEARERRERLHWSGSVRLAAGADSNVNAATADDRVRIPALGEFLLDEGARRRSSGFRELAASASVRLPLSRHRSVFADLTLSDRGNFSAHDFDLRSQQLRLGGEWSSQLGRWRLPFEVQWLQLDGRAYRRLLLVGPEWSGSVRKRPLSLFVNLGRQVYPQTPSRDGRVALAGASAPLAAWGRHRLLGALNMGSESVRSASGGHNGRRYAAVALQWDMRARPGWLLSARGDWQRALHKATDPVFSVRRRDAWRAIRLQASHPLDRRWIFRATLSLADNDSNIDFYAYRRGQLMLGWEARLQ